MKQLLTLMLIFLIVQISLAQNPEYELLLKNDTLVSNTILEFDIYLRLSTTALTSQTSTQQNSKSEELSIFELATLQPIMKFNPAISAGTITFTINSGTSDLNVVQQPTNSQLSINGNELWIQPNVPPGAGNGTIIPLGPGKRIGRFRLTSTTPFLDQRANIFWKNSEPDPITKVNAYIDGTNVNITDTSHHSVELINNSLSPLTILSTSSRPDGTAGIQYQDTLIASGGTLPYSWSIISGSLPTGLLLSSTGVLSGLPTIASTSNFTVRVIDSIITTIDKSFSLKIEPGILDNFLIEAESGGSIGTQTAGVGFNIKITARDIYNNTATSYTGTVDITSNGTITSGSGTTTSFVAGVLSSHSITMISAGSNMTITATRTGGSESGVSNSFTINPNTASRLTIQTQPSPSVTAGIVFPQQPVIRIEDLYGNLRTADNSTIITAARNLGSGIIQGTLTAISSGGIASFTNLYYTIAENITIQFTSGSLTSATSNTISVSPASADKVLVETMANGSGTILPSQNITSGNSITVYSIARDSFNNFVNNIAANWSLLNSTGGVVGSDLLSSGDNKSAIFTGRIVGTTLIKATSGSLDSILSGTIIVIAGQAKNLSFVQQPTNDTAGTVITPPVTIQLKDSLGNNVSSSGVLVTLSLSSGTGTLNGTKNKATDASGLATFNDLSIDIVGTKILTATSGILTPAISNSFMINPAAPTRLAFSQHPTNTVAGSIITPAVSVQLKDAYDNDVPLSSIAVTLAIATGTDTLKGTKTQLTDATGLASFNDLYIHLIGSKTILATSTSLTSATSNSFTITPATAVRIVVETASDGSGSSVPAQTVISGNSISCYAITRDTFNNFIANNIATWSLKNTTGGVVGSDLIPFDGNRAATFTGHLSGSSNIEASSGSLTPIPSGTITVAAGNAKQLGFTQQPTNTIAGNSITPAVTVQLKDSLGNNVSIPGVLITLTLTTGTGTLSGTTTQSTDGAGLTTFNNLSINKTGSKILTATSGSLTSATSNSFTISAATPVNISFTQQPPSSDTAGTILTPSIIVNIKDSFDNNVPLAGDTIDISLSSGSGTLSGTLMKVTDANGAATFNNLSIEKSGIKTLTASSNNYGSAVSNAFTINPSAAYKIIVETTADGNGTTVPTQTLSSGSTIIGYAITRDVYDNLLPTDTALTWSLQFITDSVKQTDLVSNVSCKCATFTARLIGSAQIHIQKAGLLSINSGTITVIAGDPSRLAFSQQPSDAIAGAIISPPIQVCIKDLAGNNIQQDGDTINITLKSGTGVLNGSTLRLTDATGIATFNDLSITLPGQKTLQASHRVYTAVISDTFSLGTYTITASAGANGTISPSGAIGVIHGANQSFTISPNTGYHIFDVLVDGTSAGPVTNYTFNNVTGNHTISASFAIDTLTITASSSTNGTITPSGAVKVTYGSNQTFTFNPSAGYHVLNFIVDGTTQTAAPSYTFTNVITNHTISVNFVPDSLSITSSTGGNGIISPLGIVRVGYGMNKSFTFTPDTGYHIFDVIVDGSSVGRPTSYTFNNVTVNHTISVSFAIDTLTITSTAGSNGTITPSGTIKLTYGSSQTFIISPEIGYHILDVVVNGISVGAVPSYTFSNIKTNHSISASFAINTYTITAAAGANGTISPSGLVPINHGSSQTFSIRPNTGYHIDSVKVDNIYFGTDTIYTFTNVTTDHTITATFVPNIITVTVQTNPAGLSFTVDGTTYSTTQIFVWTAAENHVISTDSIQSGTPGTRNVWNSWTNAATIIDTITPLVNTTFTANFTTQYYLTMNANPGGTVTPSSGWFNKSQNLAITGIPDSNYSFNVWSGSGSGSYSGSDNPASITMNAPITEVASFKQNPIHITVQTNPHGRSFSYDDTTYTVKQTFTVNPGTQHFLNVVTTQPGGTGIQYVWNSWSDNQPAYHSIFPTTDTTFTANFTSQFYLTMNAGPGGTVTPVSSWYDSGTTVIIKAIPNTGYIFKEWLGTGTGSYSGTIDSTVISIKSPISQSASFAIDTLTIMATAGANGSISPSGDVQVLYGGNQSFTITPDSLYHISDVVVDGSSVGAQTSYTFTNVTTDHTIIASFTITGYTITATAGANGTISPAGPISVEHGTDQSFTITPNTGYHIDSVFVDGSYIGAPTSYTFENVTSNHTISVKFAIDQFIIDAIAGIHGSISPSGMVSVAYGSDKTFTFLPDTGYHIDSVFIDDVYQGSETSYTFTNITTNHSIYITFNINQYTITSSSGANGSINPLGSTVVTHGDSISFIIMPDTGYHIANVIVDGVSVGTPTSYIFNNVNSDHTIEATFSINTYIITASIIGDGSIIPSGSVVVSHGETKSFSITPNTGYHLDSVFADGSYVDSTTSYTFYNVQSDHTINVIFSIDQFKITASTGSNGSITPSGVVDVTYGSNRTFTFTPDTGYHVDSFFVDGIYQGSASSYTFTNITTDHTISVTFAINQYTVTSTAGTHGTINPLGVSTVNYGDSLGFRITPEDGYHILSVIVDGSSVGTPTSYTFKNISADHTISVTFSINGYTISASTGANGSIIPEGNIAVTHGATQIFSIKPNINYHIDSVIVDNLFAGADSIYTFNNITSDHTIHATFSIDQISVIVQTNPSNLSILVDDNLYPSPHEFSWAFGSTHTIAAVDTQNISVDTRCVYTGWSDGGMKKHTVIPIRDTVFNANYTVQYFLTMNAETGGAVAPPSGWYDSAKIISIKAIPNIGYKFEGWQGTGVGSYSDTGNPAEITMHSPITENALFTRYPANITVQTNPPGLSILVDDTVYTSPYVFRWLTASSHNISVIDTQSGPTATRYVWSSWSDGGNKSHSISPVTDTTFTASFTTQFFLTMNSNMGGTVTPPSGWFNKTQIVTITAIPNSLFNFTTWSGTGLGSYNGSNNPAVVTMNGPITETANFTRKPVQITIGTNPPGRSFMYDSVLYTATQTRTIVPGTQHFIGASSPQADTSVDKQWVWKSWSDSGSQNHAIYPNTDSAFYANYIPQFALTVNSSPSNAGTTNPTGRMFIDSGSTVLLTAIPNSGYIFTSWTGAITSDQNPVSTIISSPQTITANFGRAILIQLNTAPSGRRIKVDDSLYTTPKTMTWLQGSIHTLFAISPQSDTDGVQHIWNSWSDGGAGDTGRVVAPISDTSFTANFFTQYYLTMSSGAGGSASPASEWFPQGGTVPISAAAADGYVFNEWIGSGNGSYSGTNNPSSVTMNGPITEVATFSRILPPPILDGIPDGAAGIPTNPTLSWNLYEGATSYGIQVSTDSTFNDTTQFVLNLNNLTDTSISLPPLANLKTYFWRVNARVGIDITLYSPIRRFTTITATITVISPTMSWATGFEYKLQWTSSDLNGNVNIKLSIDSGKSYRMIEENTSNSGSATLIIPDTMVTQSIDSCRFHIESYLNNVIYDETDIFSIVPSELPTSVRFSTSIPFTAEPRNSTEYKLFGLPGLVDTIKIGSLTSGAQKTDWRMFSDNGTSENYLVELSHDSKFHTGEGFWLIKKGNLDLPQFDMILPQLDIDATYSISLHSGWNIIANPFDKNIFWNTVIEANILSSETQLYSYSAAFVSSSVLEPFKGYYFYNASNLSTLKMPYPFGSVYLKRNTIPVNWKVQLIFQSDINRDDNNFIGISPIAKSGIDALDGYKPPLFLDQGFLYFSRPEWDGKYNRFNSDFRPALGDGQVWDFEISNPRKSNGTIRFSGLEQIPNAYKIILINMLNNNPIDLRKQDQYSFQSVSSTMQFKLIVGSNEFVEHEIKKLIPETFELVQNFPNPFNSSTAISIKLPQKSEVRLEIYNTLGQRVNTLFNGELPAGIHTFNWDGSDYSGSLSATGVYFYCLSERDNIIQTKKMLMIK